jgi:hypothetical protein
VAVLRNFSSDVFVICHFYFQYSKTSGSSNWKSINLINETIEDIKKIKDIFMVVVFPDNWWSSTYDATVME